MNLLTSFVFSYVIFMHSVGKYCNLLLSNFSLVLPNRVWWGGRGEVIVSPKRERTHQSRKSIPTGRKLNSKKLVLSSEIAIEKILLVFQARESCNNNY